MPCLKVLSESQLFRTAKGTSFTLNANVDAPAKRSAKVFLNIDDVESTHGCHRAGHERALRDCSGSDCPKGHRKKTGSVSWQLSTRRTRTTVGPFPHWRFRSKLDTCQNDCPPFCRQKLLIDPWILTYAQSESIFRPSDLVGLPVLVHV